MLFILIVEMKHAFRSRWQVDHLSMLVENKNASESLKRMMKGSFCHWIGDHVNHNVQTLDEKGTLHAMEITATTTGPNVSNQDLPKIPQTKL